MHQIVVAPVCLSHHPCPEAGSVLNKTALLDMKQKEGLKGIAELGHAQTVC
jgi:hypothetical protein